MKKELNPLSVNPTKKYLLINEKGKIIMRFRLKLTALRWKSSNTKVMTLREYKDRVPFEIQEIKEEVKEIKEKDISTP